MKFCRVIHSCVILLGLSACSQVPVLQTSLTTDIQAAAGTSARLPFAGDAYLDSDWFSQTLSANRVVQTALLNNPDVRAELARLDGVQAERMQAGLIDNPMLSAMALRPNGGGRFELNYNLMQSLFDVLTRSRRIAVADAAQARVEAEVLLRIVAIAQDSKAAFYRSLLAAETVRVAEQQLDLQRTMQNLSQQQQRVGAIAASDLLQQTATLAMRNHALREAKSAQINAMSELAEILGLPSSAQLRLPLSLVLPVIDGLNAEQAQQLAKLHRTELRVGNANVAQAQADRRLQTGALRASKPAAGLAGTRESGGTLLNGIALQISIPIFDTGRARSNVADAKIREAQFREQTQARKIPLQVERALALVAENQLNLQQSAHHLQQQKQLSLLAKRNYRNGSSEASTWLDAQANELEIHQQYVITQAAVIEGMLALEQSTGVSMLGY